MEITKDSVRNLLTFLEREYPAGFESLEKIQDISINPTTLFKNLFFCHEERLIEASPIEESGDIVDFRSIRINSNGISWLLGVKKRPEL